MAKYPRFMNEYRSSVMSDAASKLSVDALYLEWQIDLPDLCKEEPDRRTVHWYYSEQGCKGKSFRTIWEHWCSMRRREKTCIIFFILKKYWY